MTTDEFAKIVADWLATAKHPRFNRPYNELIYQPMVELLTYLAQRLQDLIVSGGGVEFMRVWTEKAYGIPPEQVVGSSGVTQLRARCRRQAVAAEAAKVAIHRRGPGKPVGINMIHRPPPDLRLRQLRRRPSDAAMDHGGKRRALRRHRPPHRRRARICLRPAVEDRKARQGVGRGEGEGLDRRRHEEGLEEGIRVRTMVRDVRERIWSKSLFVALALSCVAGAVAAQTPQERLLRSAAPSRR